MRAAPVFPTPSLDTRLIAAIVLLACFCHLFRIDALPMGFYVDESSIGYNAYLISTTGRDEHGIAWPLFFKAFGEYKNPLYIYLLAALYRVLGYSEWTTRALSAFCWLAGSGCLYALSRRLFPDGATRIYIALCLAFTPWLFALSRISFELIVAYPLLALHLLALHRGFDESSPRWALISGVALGLCFYAYTTFRLLAPLYGLLVLICYAATRHRKAQVLFMIGATIAAAPYVVYALSHFDALSGRFNSLTYLNDPTLGGTAKLWAFLSHYAGYFGPSFLALFGDPNRRHHTGFGGELLVTTAVLLAVALVTTGRRWRNPLRLYLALALLLSPVAAALTRDVHHSLRAFPMVVFAIPLSAYGLCALKLSIARATVAVTALCALLYTVHYFTIYPARSAVSFENYGFKDTLKEAVERTRGRIVLSDTGEVPYINLRFFGSLMGASVPLVLGSREDLQSGDVFIFYDHRRGAAGMYGLDLSAIATSPSSPD
jgi:4-amino-4-deoxy-L-arabinose transferase-like glycosyltransferase